MQPSKVLATVNSEASASTLSKSVSGLSSQVEVKVLRGQNRAVIESCDVIILACPPNLKSQVLSEEGINDALRGKLLISVLAGVTTQSIEGVIHGSSSPPDNRCWVARALPNLAVAQHASATAIETFDPNFPADKAELVNAIFKQLGGTVDVAPSLMDACTVTCGSTPAFIALFLDGFIDGAVAAGVPRNKADVMIAQVLASTAALLADGQRPSALRESVCAMPGCTIQGNLSLEEGGARGVAARAMKIAIDAARGLG